MSNFQNLANVALQNICDYLVWIEVYLMRQTCRTNNSKLHPTKYKKANIVYLMEQQLSELTHLDGKKLCQILHKSKNMLHGSFVLHVLFGAEKCPWKSTIGDLDCLSFSKVELPNECYLTYKESENPADWFQLYIIQQEMKLAEKFGYNYSGYSYVPIYDRELCRRIMLRPRIRRDVLPEWNFTRIGCETGRNDLDDDEQYNYQSIYDFVEKEADFDFCKVLFDGKKLHIYDFDSLQKKTTTVIAKQYKRLPFYKYGDDGLQIVQRLRERRDKYIQRGFNVITDLPTNDTECLLLNVKILEERKLEVLYVGFDRFRKVSYLNVEEKKQN